MDLAAAAWVIDRAIGVEMGVGTQKGLPQGHFYYFQAEEEKRRKSAADYLTHSYNVSSPASITSQIQYEISPHTRG